MMIDERHHIAAKALAEGNTEVEAAAAANVSKSTIARWKREADFKGLVLRYSDPLRKAVRQSPTPESLDLYGLIPAREAPLLTQLERIVTDLGQVLGKRFDLMTEEEIRDIPLRMIPQYTRAFVEGLKALQDAHDRVSGYGLVLDELSRIRDESQNH